MTTVQSGPPNYRYIVFSCYYKHGDYDVQFFRSETSCKTYIIEYLSDSHFKFDDSDDDSDDEYDENDTYEKLKGLSLDRLIDTAIEFGKIVQKNQDGWFIAHVTRVNHGQIRNYVRSD